jgi:hypothetical protein
VTLDFYQTFQLKLSKSSINEDYTKANTAILISCSRISVLSVLPYGQTQAEYLYFLFKIGMTGFEPAASCSQSRRATKLRYIPEIRLADGEFYNFFTSTYRSYHTLSPVGNPFFTKNSELLGFKYVEADVINPPNRICGDLLTANNQAKPPEMDISH